MMYEEAFLEAIEHIVVRCCKGHGDILPYLVESVGKDKFHDLLSALILEKLEKSK